MKGDDAKEEERLVKALDIRSRLQGVRVGGGILGGIWRGGEGMWRGHREDRGVGTWEGNPRSTCVGGGGRGGEATTHHNTPHLS